MFLAISTGKSRIDGVSAETISLPPTGLYPSIIEAKTPVRTANNFVSILKATLIKNMIEIMPANDDIINV